jgi:polysaccharide biosynthesis protein VpsJ
MGSQRNVKVDEALARIRSWGEERDWRGYDPYDILNSPLAPILALGTRTGRRVLAQAGKLSPLNLRPLLRVRTSHNAKAIGLVAAGYVRLAAANDDTAEAPARRWLEWLVEHPAASADDALAWGYHFPVETRICGYERGAPNTIATSFVAHALLDACEHLGWTEYGDPAMGAARYLVRHMSADGPHGPYFRYLQAEQELVHNANLLACSVVLRAARVTGEHDLVPMTVEAVRTTAASQRDDGSWPYGDADYLRWVDNFHTAYVLESLVECERSLPELRDAIARGAEFWESELFLPDGTPKYYAHRVYPLDSHSYAQAIDTWCTLSDRHPRWFERATRVAQLLIDRMLDDRGYVHFQQWRRWRSRVPYIRWSTAPSFRALAGLLVAERSRATARVAAEASEAASPLGSNV